MNTLGRSVSLQTYLVWAPFKLFSLLLNNLLDNSVSTIPTIIVIERTFNIMNHEEDFQEMDSSDDDDDLPAEENDVDDDDSLTKENDV